MSVFLQYFIKVFDCSIFLKEILQIKELIKVERFSVANAFDTSAIVYRDGPNLRNIDPYNRWRTKPGDMVTDFLIRDLRHSALFQAVFSYNQNEETRYLLEGQVNEFLESKEKDGFRAVLSFDVTFQDLSKKEVTERIVFQKSYGYAEPLEKELWEPRSGNEQSHGEVFKTDDDGSSSSY